MGCGAVETASVSTGTLKTQLKKLKYSLNLLKLRIDKEKRKADELLYAQLIKPTTQRSRALERAMVIGNARLLNQQNICSIIENEASILLQHFHFLDEEQQLQNVKGPLNNLRFCSSFVDCEQLKRFEAMLRSFYPKLPFPTDNQITHGIMKHEKSQEVAFRQQIQYLFQFSSSCSIPVETINAVGHKYRYGAEKYQG